MAKVNAQGKWRLLTVFYSWVLYYRKTYNRPYIVNIFAKQVMGQDQSTGRPGTENNSPYTVHSVNKSPNSGRERAKLEDIVVVNDGGNRGMQPRHEDPDLKKLSELPIFYPLLWGSMTTPFVREMDIFDRLDSKPALKMCLRYEDHLRQCAEAVSFDQDMLTSRIREIDAHCTSVLRKVTKRHKELTSTMNQVKRVEEMIQTVKRIDVNYKRLIPMMERLNSILPDEEKLEQFSLQPHTIQ